MSPEIAVTDLGEKLKSDDKFILLDVRELAELDHAKITDSRLEVTQPESVISLQFIANSITPTADYATIALSGRLAPPIPVTTGRRWRHPATGTTSA